METQLLDEFDQNQLPDRGIGEQLAETAFNAIEPIFFVFTRLEKDTFVSKAYSKASIPAAADVAVTCGAIGLGAWVLPAMLIDTAEASRLISITKELTKKLHAEYSLDAIRSYVLLTLYFIIEKSNEVHQYLHRGLTLANTLKLNSVNHVDSSVSIDQWTNYRKAWRSLQFCQSWLSCTLPRKSGIGNPFLVDPEAIEIVEQFPSKEAITQLEMGKLGAIIEHIQVERSDSGAFDIENTRNILALLENWYLSLPGSMQFSLLFEGADARVSQQCHLLIHALHLNAIMLITRRALVTISTRDDLSIAEYNEFLALALNCMAAANIAGRILALFAELQPFPHWDWVYIQTSDSVVCILTLAAVQKRLPDIEINLEGLSACMQCLHISARRDRLARSLHDRLQPIYLELKSCLVSEDASDQELSAVVTPFEAPDWIISDIIENINQPVGWADVVREDPIVDKAYERKDPNLQQVSGNFQVSL